MGIHGLVYNSPVRTSNDTLVDTGRGLTPAVFNGIDLTNRDPGDGWFYFDDFIQSVPVATGTAAAPTSLGSWTLTQVGSTGTAIGTGAFNTAPTDNGWIRIANGSATAGNGATLNQLGAAITPVNGMTIGFEARFRFSNVGLSTTGPQWLLGLVGNTAGSAPLVGSPPASADVSTSLVHGLLFHGNGASANTIRFQSRNGTAAGNRTVLTNLLGTQGGTDVPIATDGATAYKLGFRWVVGRSCDVFVNGVKYGGVIASSGVGTDVTRCPTALVGLAMVSQSGGVDRFIEVDWIALGVAT